MATSICKFSLLFSFSILIGMFQSHAQFLGGSADGYANIQLTNSACSIYTLNAFSGGNSDGFSQSAILNSACPITTLNAFGGGSSDGFASTNLINSACPVSTLNAFGGGNSDGYAHLSFINSICSITTLNAFGGGNGDGFSNLQLLSTCTPLPIELLLFEAKAIQSVIDIHWQTASEIDNDFFTLEKSSDGINFVEINKIQGAGNSSAILNYEYIDKYPFIGISSYRLKQTDFDGQFTYSEIINVLFDADLALDVLIYPNPIGIGNNLTIQFTQKVCHFIVIEIKDLSGKNLYRSEATLHEKEPILLKLDDPLNSGLYALSITCQNYSVTKKLIIE